MLGRGGRRSGATPTDDDNADGRISCNYYGYERGGTLDDILQGSRVTLIKMDIEGAEYNALQGAEQTIKKWHPKLAICVYHNLEDYIRIPLLLRSMAPSY